MKGFPQIAPYLIVTGREGSPGQVFLVAEQTIVLEVDDVMNCPVALLALYYTFNTNYPKSCLMFYSFLELVLIGKMSLKMTPTVSSLLANLK